ncbi:conserved hypothetical protein [Enhydrobacter sp. AX1]|nr:hypothetical protein [Enhydrobacter sp. AX1]VXB75648.1 conserved hypothetical protein [Enhydrobacter sp. AX1]
MKLDDILQELEAARQMAIEERKPASMIQASMAKAKLLGLDKGDTLTIKHNEPPIFNIVGVSPEQAKEEFRQVALEVLAKV